jgi:hypothetical protein
MAEQNYVEMAKMMELGHELEKFTMDDLEKILGWVGNPNICNGLKYWYFESGGPLKVYPKAHLSISFSRLGGVRVRFEKWTGGMSPHVLLDSSYANPESVRQIMSKVLKKAKRIMGELSDKLDRENRRANEIALNFYRKV